MADSVRKGDRGADVQRWQTILVSEGFDPNGVDGVFGNGTAQATREFQRRHGLTADAIVGRKTWAAAEVAIGEPEALRRGSRGPDVEKWQRLLSSAGFDPNGIDGIFGSGTERATKQFQSAKGLQTDGVVAAPDWSAALDRGIAVLPANPASANRKSGFLKDTIDVSRIVLEPSTPAAGRDVGVTRVWNRYGGLLTRLSDQLAIDPVAAAAVLAIESGGAGMTDLGPIIRFENHIFFDRWGASQPATFDDHFTFDSSRRWQSHRWRSVPTTDDWRVCHRDGQPGEWDVFRFASGLDAGAAIESTSFGLAQIMGFNFRRIGYASPFEMAEAFGAGDGAQILGFFDFVATSSGGKLVTALQSNDWTTFATGYNGAGKATQYADRMIAAHDQLRAAM